MASFYRGVQVACFPWEKFEILGSQNGQKWMKILCKLLLKLCFPSTVKKIFSFLLPPFYLWKFFSSPLNFTKSLNATLWHTLWMQPNFQSSQLNQHTNGAGKHVSPSEFTLAVMSTRTVKIDLPEPTRHRFVSIFKGESLSSVSKEL